MKQKKEIDYERIYWFNIIYILFMFIFIIGETCNFVAVTNNGGKMPVYTYYYVDNEKHFSYYEDDKVNYPILTDIIKLPTHIMSIGDLTMIIAVIGLFTTVIINVFTRWGAYKR
jgi:hypothetical protein